MTRQVWIGTSGWTYDGWRGPFYPTDIPKGLWLAHYGQRFGTAEVNSSFYRTPSLEAVCAWRDAVPPDFLFAWKVSKFITHWKRLGPTSSNSIELMVTRLKVLAPKVGPVLFQLPARFKADRTRLASFLKLLPRRYRYAFEFRDPSWYDDVILRLLREADISLCISDHRDAPAPWEVTAEHVYVRGHGPGGDYRGRYRKSMLRQWADEFARWRKRGHTVYCYFDNDQKSAAPLDAASLQGLVDASPLPRVKAAARRSR